MVFTPNGQKGLRTSLEDTYQRRDLVHLAAGSRVPLLRQHIWLVTRGMVKLSCITEQGDDLVGPVAIAARLVEHAPDNVAGCPDAGPQVE